MYRLRWLLSITTIITVLILGVGSVGAQTAPSISVPGIETDYTGSPVFVAPDLVIQDNGFGNLDGANVLIGTGFNAAQDQLSINNLTSGSVGAINYNYNTTTGVLALTGSDTISNYQAALRLVTYINTQPAATTTPRAINFSLGTELQNPENGHFYEFVTADAITWTNANTAADGLDYFGLQGYLVTVTSASENTFVFGKLQGQGWMGASDNPAVVSVETGIAGTVEGQWYWVTGPEAGTNFCTDIDPPPTGDVGDCVSVNSAYANWATGEPNNCCSSTEHYLHYLANGQWNDYAVNNANIDGYVVEYGGMPGDPTLAISDSISVITDQPPFVSDVTINPNPAEEGSLVTVTPNVTDINGTGGITYQLGPGAPDGAVIDPVTGVVTWTPGEGDGGNTYTFPIIISDGNNTVEQPVTITVNEVNNGNPSLGVISSGGNVNEGQVVSFTAVATDADFPLNLTYSLGAGAPAGASINPATGAFNWTAAEDQGGLSFTFDVIVSDGVTADSQQLTYNVIEVQSPPVLPAIGNRNIAKLETLTFTAAATDIDLPVQTLTYALDAGSVTDVTFDPTTGAFNWATDVNVIPGTYPMTITVTDSNGDSDSETFNVIVGFTLNLLINGSFEEVNTTTPKLPSDWVPVRLNGDRRKCPPTTANVPEGSCVFRFRPSGTEFSRIRQKANLTLEGLDTGDVLTLRGQFKSPQKSKMRMRLVIVYADGTRQRLTVRIRKTKNYREFSIVAPLSGIPVRAKVLIVNRSTNSKVLIDDLWLTASSGTAR